jgi:hypothetical protein
MSAHSDVVFGEHAGAAAYRLMTTDLIIMPPCNVSPLHATHTVPDTPFRAPFVFRVACPRAAVGLRLLPALYVDPGGLPASKPMNAVVIVSTRRLSNPERVTYILSTERGRDGPDDVVPRGTPFG